jgi:hypothetical protein
MADDDLAPLSDRQARAVIIAAEALGFEREPDLYEAWYDVELHEDARAAAAFLRARDADVLREALEADDPISADSAARRITNTGRFTFWHAERAIELASEHGFTPPATDLPRMPSCEAWDQARAAIAFLWDRHPALLSERLGDAVRIAPLPPSARRPGFYE